MLMLGAIKSYYRDNPEAQELNLEYFGAYVTETKYKHLPAERIELLRVLLAAMVPDVPPELVGSITGRLLATGFVSDALDKIKAWNGGDEINIVDTLATMAEEANTRLGSSAGLRPVSLTPEELMQEELDNSGLKFRLNCLSQNMRGVRGGDFGILAARVDVGKTTFLCSESTYWLSQLDQLWPGQGRVGLYLNNEGLGSRIKKRWYQSLLNKDIAELSALVEKGRVEGKPLFSAAVEKAMGMGIDRMLFYDIHGMTSAEVERIIQRTKPGFVIVDMLDNVTYTGGTSNGAERTDQVLEAMYSLFRIWCVKYDFIGLATSQLSAEAAGVRWPGLHSLKDSKTGKAGTADFIIMLGHDPDPAFANVRFISTPKNKLLLPGGKKDARSEVLFDGARARVDNPA
jgi:replicative DNA helicase